MAAPNSGRAAVKVMLDVSAPLKPMTATTVNAGSSAPPATATAPAGAKYTPAPAKPAAKASGGDDIDAILGAMVRLPLRQGASSQLLTRSQEL